MSLPDPPPTADAPGDPGNAKPFELEWGTFLTELRTTLPGVQLLFGFLLAVPFTQEFRHLGGLLRWSYFACFLCSTAACALLIAPSVYHRLHWRRDVRDKEDMFGICNRLAILGGAMLAMAMTAAVLMISTIMIDSIYSWLPTAVAFVTFGWLWFGLPLSRRNRERSRKRRPA